MHYWNVGEEMRMEQESSIGLSPDRRESHTKRARKLAAASGMGRRTVEKERRVAREEG